MIPQPEPPLVLLHGFTGSAVTWDHLRGQLGERRPTIAVDLAGHGHAARFPELASYTLPRMADDLVRLLDRNAVDRAVVLGYSLGGRVALRFALSHPERLAALVLESTSPGIIDPAARTARVQSDEALAARIERDGIAAFIDEWERLPLWQSQSALAAAIRGDLHALRLANDPVGLANSLRAAGAGVDAPVLDQLGEVTVPALVIAGALDDAYTAHARDMVAAMPRATLAIVADAGHAVHLERPREFASLVEDFVDNFARAAWPPPRPEPR